MRLRDIVEAIDGGELDDHLEVISACVRDRRKALARRRAATLRRGDTVTFTQAMSPAYLEGLTAKVVRVNHQTVTVDIPDGPEYRRHRGRKGVRLPSAALRRDDE